MMHTSAPPEIMQQHTTYSNIIADLLQFFGKQIEKFTHSGVSDIIIDPGFGFGKTLEDNYHLLQNLNAFQTLGLPILVGISRKSMIYKLLNISPEESLNGTTALHIVALQNGSSILRVHDVAAAREVITIFNQLHHK
jgi:dihydropteroate synthase